MIEWEGNLYKVPNLREFISEVHGMTLCMHPDIVNAYERALSATIKRWLSEGRIIKI
jgi:hypothetical protein